LLIILTLHSLTYFLWPNMVNVMLFSSTRGYHCNFSKLCSNFMIEQTNKDFSCVLFPRHFFDTCQFSETYPFFDPYRLLIGINYSDTYRFWSIRIDFFTSYFIWSYRIRSADTNILTIPDGIGSTNLEKFTLPHHISTHTKICILDHIGSASTIIFT
jgi:hypothetical protein